MNNKRRVLAGHGRDCNWSCSQNRVPENSVTHPTVTQNLKRSCVTWRLWYTSLDVPKEIACEIMICLTGWRSCRWQPRCPFKKEVTASSLPLVIATTAAVLPSTMWRATVTAGLRQPTARRIAVIWTSIARTSIGTTTIGLTASPFGPSSKHFQTGDSSFLLFFYLSQ